jgi:hypothetical protein
MSQIFAVDNKWETLMTSLALYDKSGFSKLLNIDESDVIIVT